jgi:hypothetical protein
MKWKHFKHELPDTELISSDEESECYYDFVPDFVEEFGYLPIECRECYKALIFWTYSKVNESNFKNMLKSIPVSIHGKYNNSVIVFYFKNKNKMISFLEILKDKLVEFSVDGRIQWRVSGRYWEDAYPQFFISAKELATIFNNTEVTIKDWLKRKGLLDD